MKVFARRRDEEIVVIRDGMVLLRIVVTNVGNCRASLGLLAEEEVTFVRGEEFEAAIAAGATVDGIQKDKQELQRRRRLNDAADGIRRTY
jgi:hypothetical protein